MIFWTALRGARILQSRYESWILEYYPETKRQSREWHTAKSPRPKKAKMSKSKIKSILICFFNLTFRGSSKRNLCHQDKLSIKLLIGKSLKDSGKGWHVCDQALHALGCCTTTMPNVTQQSPSINFWQKNAFLWFLSPPIRRISAPVTSFYSPGSKTN